MAGMSQGILVSTTTAHNRLAPCPATFDSLLLQNSSTNCTWLQKQLNDIITRKNKQTEYILCQYLENVSSNIFQHSNNIHSHLMVNFVSQHLLFNNKQQVQAINLAMHFHIISFIEVIVSVWQFTAWMQSKTHTVLKDLHSIMKIKTWLLN